MCTCNLANTVILIYGLAYSTKGWWEKTMANLAIVYRFAEVFLSKHCQFIRIFTQFAKVFPLKYTGRVISSKFHPVNILRHTVLCILIGMFV